MGKIYVIGLGPGSVDDLTLGAVNRINSKQENFLRTENHPTVEYFKNNSIEYEAFDYLYNKEADFSSVYNKIVDRLVEESLKGEDINYFVPGNPLVAERTVEILLEREVNVEIVDGMSFIDPLIKSVKRDPIDGLKIVDGTSLNADMVDINVDIIVTQVYNQRIMSDIKLILSEIYGDEYSIYIVDSAGIKGEEKVEKTPIYLMDRFEKIGYLTSIYIPRKENEEIYNFNDVKGILRKLRGEDGCPWDIKQTHKSLRKHIIEEAYELVDAIDRGDVDGTVEEAGDLLLQVVFLVQIAYDDGEFTEIDVTTGLVKKLINRHPHIFLEEKVAKSEEIVYNWERMKDLQRGYKTIEEKMNHVSGLPSLMTSLKIQKIASKVGFDWDSIDGPLGKIEEEYNEIIEELDSPNLNLVNLEEEIGDLFFAIVNLARFNSIDPEVSINKANNKFLNRLKFMEEESSKDGKKLTEMTLEEMERLWGLAKENNL